MSLNGERTANSLSRFFYLAGAESFLCSIALGLLFYDLQKKLLADFSILWALSMLTVFAAGVVFLLAGLKLAQKAVRFLSWIHLRIWLIFLSLALGLGCCAAVYLGPALPPAWQPFTLRSMPLLVWAGLIGLQAAVTIAFLFRQDLTSQLRSDLLRPTSRWSNAAVMLGLAGMLATAMIQAVPTLLLGSGQAALRAGQEALFTRAVQLAWAFCAAANLIAAALLIKRHGSSVPRKVFMGYLLALAVCLTLLCGFSTRPAWYGGPSKWNVFYLTPDSMLYLNQGSTERPPLYPLFIQGITRGVDLSAEAQEYPQRQPIEDVNSGLMHVVKTQKVLLLICALVLCSVMMAAIRSPLLAPLLLWLYHAGYLSPLIDEVVPETLVSSLLLLLLAVFFSYLQKPNPALLLFGGLLTAAIYAARLASIYSVIILLAMILWGWLQEKQRVLPWAGLALLSFFALLYASAALVSHSSLASNSKFGAAAKLTCFSLHVARPEDVEAMPDDTTRLFFERAFARFQVDAAYAAGQDWQPVDRSRFMLGNCFNQAYARAYALDATHQGDDGQINRLLWKVVVHVIRRHPVEYLQYSGQSFLYGVEISRFKPAWFLATLAAIIFIGSMLRRGWIGYACAVLALTHFAHLVVIVLFDQPIMRYVWASEFLLYLALFLLLWALFEKIRPLGHDSHSPAGAASVSS